MRAPPSQVYLMGLVVDDDESVRSWKIIYSESKTSYRERMERKEGKRKRWKEKERGDGAVDK